MRSAGRPSGLSAEAADDTAARDGADRAGDKTRDDSDTAEDGTDGDAEADAEADAAACTPPPDGPAGRPCASDEDCELGYRCLAEQVEIYRGEIYVQWRGGYCMSSGPGDAACDVRDPAS